MDKLERLTRTLKDIAVNLGADLTGIVRKIDLEGGPPSADISYLLPKARTAFCFALALDQGYIEDFLAKKDWKGVDRDNIRANTMAGGIALGISDFLKMKGFNSVPIASNLVYRTDTPNGALDEKPPVSHRYLAVRSGIGWFGRSGNVITKEFGAAVILGAVATEAELIPTEPLKAEENYCDDCKLCHAACPSGYMDPKEMTNVQLGNESFSYSKLRHHSRCDYVCGGFTGLHGSGKWSTWAPGRFEIPDKDDEFFGALINSAQAYKTRPKPEGGFHHFLMPGYRTWLTCCGCAFICVPEKEERNRRFKTLRNSGVVVQNEDGSLEAMSPEEARERLDGMVPEVRGFYERVE